MVVLVILNIVYITGEIELNSSQTSLASLNFAFAQDGPEGSEGKDVDEDKACSENYDVSYDLGIDAEGTITHSGEATIGTKNLTKLIAMLEVQFGVTTEGSIDFTGNVSGNLQTRDITCKDGDGDCVRKYCGYL